MRRPLLRVSAAATGLFGLVASVGMFVRLWRSYARGIDFRVYQAADAIGLANGWQKIYDLDSQGSHIRSLFPAGARWTPFASPPEVAWLVLPFRYAPPGLAVVAWSAVLGVAIGASVLLAGGRRAAPISLLSVLVLPGTTWDLASGNVTGVIMLGLAVSGVLLTQRRDLLGGLVLAVIFLKPQLAWAVPVALATVGRWRALAAATAMAALLVVLTLMVITPDGVRDYSSVIREVSGLAGPRRFSLDREFHSPAAAATARVLTLATAFIAAWRQGRHDPRPALAAGLAGSLEVTPYLNVPDLVLPLLVVWWISRDYRSGRWSWLLFSYWATTILAVFWELPWLVTQFVVLGALALATPVSRGVTERDPQPPRALLPSG